MGLKDYFKKRDLKQSKEPASGKQRHKGFNFCIQKHAARRLHYDLRLEYKGVLLSWAIPKGPSMNPEDKRLAIHVEDHPLDYQYFEGVIPKGNYGAGVVEIWDNGTYDVPADDLEDYVGKGLKKGHFSLIFHGKKLHGEFSFIRINNESKSEWLLIKKNDLLTLVRNV